MNASERIQLNPATIRPLAPEPASTPSIEPGRTPDGKTFGEVLHDTATQIAAVPSSVPGSSITWSAHASARLRQRGIELTPSQHQRLEAAVDKAAAKGARDSLVLLDDNAFVVSARNRTVITAIDIGQAKENVFTNIDSAVIA